jgi:hypothetical protein
MLNDLKPVDLQCLIHKPSWNHKDMEAVKSTFVRELRFSQGAERSQKCGQEYTEATIFDVMAANLGVAHLLEGKSRKVNIATGEDDSQFGRSSVGANREI